MRQVESRHGHNLAAHFMVSECDGGLYDTRKPGWEKKPVRPNYRRTYSRINSLAQVKATIRAGEYTFPGCYPMFFITQDGASLCFNCARKEFRQVAWDYLNSASTGWRIAACAVNYEDHHAYCDHCNTQIESAY